MKSRRSADARPTEREPDWSKPSVRLRAVRRGVLAGLRVREDGTNLEVAAELEDLDARLRQDRWRMVAHDPGSAPPAYYYRKGPLCVVAFRNPRGRGTVVFTYDRKVADHVVGQLREFEDTGPTRDLGRAKGPAAVEKAEKKRVPARIDAAKHHRAAAPGDADPALAFLHAGYFLGWIVERGWLSEALATDRRVRAAASRVRTRRMTGLELVRDHLGDAVHADQLSPEAREFAADEYDAYLADYARLLEGRGQELYRAKHSWATAGAVQALLDKRFRAWRKLRDEA